MPHINEDIDEVLPLVSETGPINIPIICTTKKVKDDHVTSQTLTPYESVLYV